jgi:hypothetical protein
MLSSTLKWFSPPAWKRQIVERRVQDIGQVCGQRRHLVTDADQFEVRVLAVHRGADAAHRVAEVEHPGVGADRHDVAADVQDRRDDAQGMKQAAWPAILAVNLADAVLLRDVPILLPQLEAVAHLDGDDAEVGALQCGFAVGGCFQREGQVVRLDVATAKGLSARQRLGVDVVQADRAAGEDLAPEQVAHHAQTKVGAARADEDDFVGHGKILARLGIWRLGDLVDASVSEISETHADIYS